MTLNINCRCKLCFLFCFGIIFLLWQTVKLSYKSSNVDRTLLISPNIFLCKSIFFLLFGNSKDSPWICLCISLLHDLPGPSLCCDWCLVTLHGALQPLRPVSPTRSPVWHTCCPGPRAIADRTLHHTAKYLLNALVRLSSSINSFMRQWHHLIV